MYDEICPNCGSDYLEWVNDHEAVCLICGSDFDVRTMKILRILEV